MFAALSLVGHNIEVGFGRSKLLCFSLDAERQKV